MGKARQQARKHPSPPPYILIAVPAVLVEGVETLIQAEFPGAKYNAADLIRWLLMMHLSGDDLRVIERSRPGYLKRLRAIGNAQQKAARAADGKA